MKRNCLVLAAMALLLSACAKEISLPQNRVVLTAGLEQQEEPAGTKTQLGSDLNVIWSAGDAIKVYMQEGTAYDFALETGAGETVATFKNDEAVGTPTYAVYPSTVAAGISGSTISFTLPAEQTYAENTFADGANVAVAKVDGTTLNFKNVCGVLKLSLRGVIEVDRIELTSNNGEKLNGEFSVDASSSTPSVVAGDAANDDEKKITLNCNGVQLDPTTPKSFYFVVPTQAFGDAGNPGFSAKVIDVNGDSFYATVSTTKANTINRSVIRRMPETIATIVPADYVACNWIKCTSHGSRDHYLNLGVIPIDDTGYRISLNQKCPSKSTALFGSRINASNSRVMGGWSDVNEHGKNRIFVGWNDLLFFGEYIYDKSSDYTITTECNFYNSRMIIVNGETLATELPELTLNFSERPYLVLGTWARGSTSAYDKIDSRAYALNFVVFTNKTAISNYFVPVKCASGPNEGQIGVLDLVTNNFIAPTGDAKIFAVGTELK